MGHPVYIHVAFERKIDVIDLWCTYLTYLMQITNEVQYLNEFYYDEANTRQYIVQSIQMRYSLLHTGNKIQQYLVLFVSQTNKTILVPVLQ